MPVAFENRTECQAGGQGGADGKATENRAGHTSLSDAAVEELARRMWIPEGLFRMVIDRYPALNRVLARRYRNPTCTA
jgi:hypothetical protein